MSTEVKEFYSNDIVYRFDKRKRIKFGVVVDSYEASTDADEFHALKKGQIRVLWLNNSREQVWRQNKVRLMSRSVIPGDIVRRLEQGKETQRGYCKESKQYATVQIVGTDKIIEKVSSERLSTVCPYGINVTICLGNRYGRIQNFDQKIKMQSKCGSIVEVLSSINHDIEDYWFTKRNRGFFEPFYPGQEVTCTPSSLEQANWLHKSKQMRRNMSTRQRFTVQTAETTDIEVAWHECYTTGCTVTDLKPDELKSLKLLEPTDNHYLELAERRLLKLSSSDTLVKKRNWIQKQSAMHYSDVQKVRHVITRSGKRTPKFFRSHSLLSTCVDPKEIEEDWLTEDGEELEEISDNGSSCSSISATKTRKRHFPPKPKELVPGKTLAVEVLCVDSKATIVWQDGTEEKDVPTTQLYYSISLDDHEFFPGEWVVSEVKDDDSGKYGAVQNVNYLERTATVKWFSYSEAEKMPIYDNTNEMSVYDLKKHSLYAFRPGSVVKRKPVEENKLGHVLDSCPQGHVIVQWIDGIQENCFPQNLELIPETIEYDLSYDENEDSAQVSWETESIESFAGDITDETMLQNMAARLDFVRNRIIYLKEAFRMHSISENFVYLRDLLMVYDNSSYLDKLLDTSFFSLKSKHFQALLVQVRERAKTCGVELRGRLFSLDNLVPSSSKSKVASAEKENITKVMKLEHKINAQIENSSKDSGTQLTKDSGEPSTPQTPDVDFSMETNTNLCIELLSMLKARMDLAYAEIISRIGGNQALSVMTKASESLVPTSTSTPMPSMPTTPEDNITLRTPRKLFKSVIQPENESYAILEEAHVSHRFYLNKVDPTDKQRFHRAVQKEYKLLKESLPPGVWVRSYSNRLDLLSVMIRGPHKTPYEDGLFLFDVQLGADYPRSPPLCHYISYSSERLNPNLYAEGKVCVSLLGTWMGRGTEVWGPNSTLLQLIVSIQGLILVSEPYYNEAGYEKQSESQQGYENSRTYNELVVLKLVQSMTEMLKSPPEVFKQEVLNHFADNGGKLCERLGRWCIDEDPWRPDFPLLPVSKGLRLSLNTSLEGFQTVLEKMMAANDKRGQGENVDVEMDVDAINDEVGEKVEGEKGVEKAKDVVRAKDVEGEKDVEGGNDVEGLKHVEGDKSVKEEKTAKREKCAKREKSAQGEENIDVRKKMEVKKNIEEHKNVDVQKSVDVPKSVQRSLDIQKSVQKSVDVQKHDVPKNHDLKRSDLQKSSDMKKINDVHKAKDVQKTD